VEGHTYAEASIPWTDLAVYVSTLTPTPLRRDGTGAMTVSRTAYRFSALYQVLPSTSSRVWGSIIQSPDAADTRGDDMAVQQLRRRRQLLRRRADRSDDARHSQRLAGRDPALDEPHHRGGAGEELIRGEMEFDDPRLLKARLTL
jgi:tetrahydromethanopterin S-methyltransferase subunit F